MAIKRTVIPPKNKGDKSLEICEIEGSTNSRPFNPNRAQLEKAARNMAEKIKGNKK